MKVTRDFTFSAIAIAILCMIITPSTLTAVDKQPAPKVEKTCEGQSTYARATNKSIEPGKMNRSSNSRVDFCCRQKRYLSLGPAQRTLPTTIVREAAQSGQ